jgi:hypothetical protein
MESANRPADRPHPRTVADAAQLGALEGALRARRLRGHHARVPGLRGRGRGAARGPVADREPARARDPRPARVGDPRARPAAVPDGHSYGVRQPLQLRALRVGRAHGLRGVRGPQPLHGSASQAGKGSPTTRSTGAASTPAAACCRTASGATCRRRRFPHRPRPAWSAAGGRWSARTWAARAPIRAFPDLSSFGVDITRMRVIFPRS